MTVSATYSPPQYVGNGATTSFSFPFQFFAAAELVVQLFDTNANANVSPAPVLNGSGTYDYTVTGVLDPNIAEFLSGASVVFNNAPLGNHRVTITRKVQRTQPIILTNSAQFPAKTIEGELDRGTLILQELDTAFATQALQHPPSDPAGLTVVAPPVATRASQFAGWDASGNFTALAPPASTTAVSSAMAPVVGAASLAVAKNLLDIPFSLFANPAVATYAVRAPQDIGTLFSSSAMGGAGTFNLPAASSAGAGAVYGFEKITNALTINRAGSDVIQGIGTTFTSLTLTVDGDMVALQSDGTNWKVISASPNAWALLGAALQSYLAGGTLSNDGVTPNTKIDVAAYTVADDTNVAMIKGAAGVIDFTVNGANGLDTSAIAASTWYHIFAISKPGGVAIALLASTNISAPTFPAGYTLKRRLGSVKTDASAHILGFSQNGDDFLWTATQPTDINNVTLTTANRTLYTLGGVPPGVKVDALGRWNGVNTTSPFQGMFSSPDEPDLTNLEFSIGSSVTAAGWRRIRTNTAQQIGIRAVSGSSTLTWVTVGWSDARGRIN